MDRRFRQSILQAFRPVLMGFSALPVYLSSMADTESAGEGAAKRRRVQVDPEEEEDDEPLPPLPRMPNSPDVMDDNDRDNDSEASPLSN